MVLLPGEPIPTAMGPMPGPGTRTISLGAVGTHVGTEGGWLGGKWRAAGQIAPDALATRGTLLGDVWGDGRLRVLAQAGHPGLTSGSRDGAASATLAGEDYVAVARVKTGVEALASYNQRLCPGSPLQLGGEVSVNCGELVRVVRGGEAGKRRTD